MSRKTHVASLNPLFPWGLITSVAKTTIPKPLLAAKGNTTLQETNLHIMQDIHLLICISCLGHIFIKSSFTSSPKISKMFLDLSLH